MNEQYLYDKARRRVKEKKEFYSNFVSWIGVSIFLFSVNLITSPRFIWAFFPFIGWGIGVFFHGLSVFSPAFGKDWEEKEIHREMKRLNSGARDHDEEYLDLDDLKDLRPKYKDSDFV
jgi:hypothetical protein